MCGNKTSLGKDFETKKGTRCVKAKAIIVTKNFN